MRNMKISTAQLAQICGVSQGTIDRALNNRSGISYETKKKIVDAAISYGYRPNASAESRQVGIIVFNLNNEYLTNLVTEVEFALRKFGFTATVMLSHYDKAYEIECIKKLYASGVDGIILCSVNSGEEFVRFISTLDIPITCVGNKIEGLPYVGVDDKAAMRALALSVKAKNYDRIIYFSPALKYDDAFAQKLRFEGFKEAMVEADNYKTVVNIDELDRLICGKSAVICSTDYYALKVFFKDLKTDIYGFDNIKMLRDYSLPIKSADYSVKEIARLSVKNIFSASPTSITIPYNIPF